MLPETLRDLLVRSDNLYRRIARLDDVLFGTPNGNPGVLAHFDRLNQAFGAQ
jgi:regulator of CtrA degradation